MKGSTIKCYKHASFLSNAHSYVCWCYKHNWEHLTNKYQSNTLNKNVIATKTHNINGSFSHTKSSVSIDLFNLPPLPDTRRQSTMQCKIPNDFFLPDGKNTQLSKIVNTWTFDRLTPNGNQGVGVQIDYLECAYRTRYYVIDKVKGQINAIHDDSLKLTEFKGCFSPFNLDNLESKVCRLAIGDIYEENVFGSPDSSPKTIL